MSDRSAFEREQLISLIIGVGMMRRDVATDVADAILSRWAKGIRDCERDRAARMIETLRAEWFPADIPGDTAVPVGAFARSMKQLAAVVRDPLVDFVETD